MEKGNLVVEEDKRRGVKLAERVVNGYSATHSSGWWRGAPVVRQERGGYFCALLTMEGEKTRRLSVLAFFCCF